MPNHPLQHTNHTEFHFFKLTCHDLFDSGTPAYFAHTANIKAVIATTIRFLFMSCTPCAVVAASAIQLRRFPARRYGSEYTPPDPSRRSCHHQYSRSGRP